jgi:PHD/YefM family antitoxin component YafN of YafNO toxin-antitoxin module
MAQIIEVTGREFRANQKTYLDYADAGAQVIIKRKRKTSYVLTPMKDDDLELSPALIESIERGLRDIREGRGTVYTLEELKEWMGI